MSLTAGVRLHCWVTAPRRVVGALEREEGYFFSKIELPSSWFQYPVLPDFIGEVQVALQRPTVAISNVARVCKKAWKLIAKAKAESTQKACIE